MIEYESMKAYNMRCLHELEEQQRKEHTEKERQEELQKQRDVKKAIAEKNNRIRVRVETEEHESRKRKKENENEKEGMEEKLPGIVYLDLT